MRKLVAVLAFAAVLMSANAAALARTIPHEAVVKSIDPQTKIVETEDGWKFKPGPGVEITGLEPGTKVVFYYYDTGKVKTIGSYEFVRT